MGIKVKKRGHGFLIGLGVFFLCSLLLGAGGLYYLWGSLESYESNTPTASMQRYLEQLKAQDYDAIYASSGFEETTFTGKEQYIAYLKKLYAGNLETAVFMKQQDKTPGNPLYAFYLDGKEAAKLELTTAPPGSPHRWRVHTVPAPIGDYTVVAPAHVEAFANGKPLTAAQQIAQGGDTERFSGLPEGVTAPVLTTYELKEMLLPPEITGKNDAGEAYTVQLSGNHFTVTVPVSAEKKVEYSAVLEKAAKAYAAYITKDLRFAQFKTYLYEGTEFYTAMKGFYNGWYNDHDSLEYRNVSVTELCEYADDAFTGEITFDYVIKMGGKEHVYPSVYQMAFLKKEGQWKLVNLVIQ